MAPNVTANTALIQKDEFEGKITMGNIKNMDIDDLLSCENTFWLRGNIVAQTFYSVVSLK